MAVKATKKTKAPSVTAVKAATKSAGKRNRRLSPEERSLDIIDKAIELFADVGFDGSTRELAKRLGITQPLLYRYFPTKEHLIREVYRTVYLNRWQPEWETLLSDRSRPLHGRLQEFYNAYTEAIFSREWIRIYLFSGLRGFDINKWYIKLVEDRILKRICIEYRHELGCSARRKDITELELEATWTLHGGIFYYGVRKHIYGLPVAKNKDDMIVTALEVFFVGSERIFLDAGP